MFRKLRDKIRDIRSTRKLKKLFPGLPAVTKFNKLDKDKYNTTYCMSQETLDMVKNLIPEEKLANYKLSVVPDSLLKKGEVMEVHSPKDPKPVEIVYGAPMQPIVTGDR